mmetsp:Transcript_6138/g.14921  ORF Transcript_6138/g.14921 Transcript_6138/m.14921 type:complete len:92 (+) Transcript_6138:716-991(+)
MNKRTDSGAFSSWRLVLCLKLCVCVCVFLLLCRYWEQIDNGKRWTNTRKGLLITPVVLYLAASNSVDFSRQPLLLNLLAMLGLLIPKLKDQ